MRELLRRWLFHLGTKYIYPINVELFNAPPVAFRILTICIQFAVQCVWLDSFSNYDKTNKDSCVLTEIDPNLNVRINQQVENPNIYCFPVQIPINP